MALYEQGRLEDAETICRKLLRGHPRHFDAAHLLGVIHLDQGRPDAAERQIRLALSIDKNNALAHNSRGIALKDLGRLDEALACFDAAVRLQPHYVEALANCGAALHALDRFEDALGRYDAAIALHPNFAGALCNRGNTLIEIERFGEALAGLDKALSLIPQYPKALNSRGLALHGLKQFDDAVESYTQAIALQPHYAEAFYNRGSSLRELGRNAEALESYDRAIALGADQPDYFNGRGLALHGLKRIGEALASYDKALALKPHHYEALNNRAQCELAAGDMAAGWRHAEHRWLMKNFDSRRPALAVPQWEGEDLSGRSILVYAEQGFGDMIQFCRYLPLLEERGARVSFLAPEKLHRLFSGLSGGTRLLSSLDGEGSFDTQCALMSLPYRFGTELDSIPAAVPYLSPDDERAAFWARRIGADGFRVGVCWQGNPHVLPGRSFSLRELLPLSRIEGVRLISLQKGFGEEQVTGLADEMRIGTLGDLDAGADAFVDTAAVMASLDLVISCDTAVAHLAGALGRPTWVALKYVPDWRWLLERNDSPWYPTMRLYRQTVAGDWRDVMSAMQADLTRTVQAGRSLVTN